MKLVAVASDDRMVVPLVQEHLPDLLLLDLGLPGIDGQEVWRPWPARVVTARLDALSVRQSLPLGAAG